MIYWESEGYYHVILKKNNNKKGIRMRIIKIDKGL